MEEITGADSYPYVLPVLTGTLSDPISLQVWDHGKNLLTNVAASIFSGNDFVSRRDNFDFFHRPEDELALLQPGFPRLMKQVITPNDLLKAGGDVYLVYMYTTSGNYFENITFRANKGMQKWIWKIEVRRSFEEHHGFRAKQPVLLCGTEKWSDEPADQRSKSIIYANVEPCEIP